MIEVLRFLRFKSQSLMPTTILGYVTAISDRHAKVKVGHKAVPLARLSTVQTWFKGLKQRVGVPRRLIPPWSLEIVLSDLKKPPFEPLESADSVSRGRDISQTGL